MVKCKLELDESFLSTLHRGRRGEGQNVYSMIFSNSCPVHAVPEGFDSTVTPNRRENGTFRNCAPQQTRGIGHTRILGIGLELA